MLNICKTNLEIRGRICEFDVTERLKVSHHIWYKNAKCVKKLLWNVKYQNY